MGPFASQAELAMAQHSNWMQVERPKTQLIMPIPPYDRTEEEEQSEELYLQDLGETSVVMPPGSKMPGYEEGNSWTCIGHELELEHIYSSLSLQRLHQRMMKQAQMTVFKTL